MPTFSGKVRSDGSVMIPDELRVQLGIQPGSDVEWFQTLDGQIYFHHLTDQFLDFGAPARRPPISVQEMDLAVAEEVVDRDAATRRHSRKPAAE